VTFKEEGKLSFVYAAEGRKATLYINGSTKENIHYGPVIEGDMDVLEKGHYSAKLHNEIAPSCTMKSVQLAHLYC
jgi:hypothetical protein